jgi:hypothetical protein
MVLRVIATNAPVTNAQFATEALAVLAISVDTVSLTVQTADGQTATAPSLSPWSAWVLQSFKNVNAPPSDGSGVLTYAGGNSGTGFGISAVGFYQNLSLPVSSGVVDPLLPDNSSATGTLCFNPATAISGGVSTSSGSSVPFVSGGTSGAFNLSTSNKVYFRYILACDGTKIFVPFFVPSFSELVPSQVTAALTAAQSTLNTAPAAPATSFNSVFSTPTFPTVLTTSFEFDLSSQIPDVAVLINGIEQTVRKKSSKSLDLLGQYSGVVTVQYRKPQARVYINGVLQSPTLYSVVGDTIVFVTPPANLAKVDIGIDYLSERVSFEIQGDSLRDLKKLSYIYMDMALPEEQGQPGGLDLEYWIDGDRQRGVFIPNVYRHPELTWGTAIWNGSYPTSREDTRAKIPARGLFHYMKLRFRNKGPGSFSINGWELKVKQLGQKAK